jgi:large conductance mechanosensitive channel
LQEVQAGRWSVQQPSSIVRAVLSFAILNLSVHDHAELKTQNTKLTMAMFGEFREFAFKGNVIDLAIGIIIGAAFGKIVASLVNNIFMPIIGLILGKVDFSNLFIVLNGQHAASLKEAADKGIPVLAYGMFINTVIEFLIIAFCLFLVIKQVNRFKKPAPPAGPSTEEKLLTEIRDLLKPGRQA